MRVWQGYATAEPINTSWGAALLMEQKGHSWGAALLMEQKGHGLCPYCCQPQQPPGEVKAITTAGASSCLALP